MPRNVKVRVAFLGIIAYVLFSALAFSVVYEITGSLFGLPFPPLTLWQVVFAGNALTMLFQYTMMMVMPFFAIKGGEEADEKVFDRH